MKKDSFKDEKEFFDSFKSQNVHIFERFLISNKFLHHGSLLIQTIYNNDLDSLKKLVDENDPILFKTIKKNQKEINNSIKKAFTIACKEG